MAVHDSKLQVSIIGLGAVGRSLAFALSDAGYPLLTFVDRQLGVCKKLGRDFPHVLLDTDAQAVRPETEVLLICVPDEQIAVVDRSLGMILPKLRLRTCAHTSGVLTASVLKSATDLNIPVASFHPMQTFPRSQAVTALAGIHFALEGDQVARGILEKMVGDLGGKSFNIASEHKPMYHAAAVIVSNFIPVLLRSSAELMACSGMSERGFIQMASPLVRQSLENSLTLSPLEALTGPIARGDVLTVKRHLAALRRESPVIMALYRMLSLKVLEMAVEKGLPDEQFEKLRQLLTEF